MKDAVVFLEPKGAIFEVVRAAFERGFKTVALTSDIRLIENAPEAYRKGAASFDKIIYIQSWNDESGIFQAIDDLKNKYSIKGLYFGMETCAPIGAQLRKQLDLPTPSVATFSLILNKFLLRRKLKELGLSNLKNFHGTEVDRWTDWKFSGPAYFKPIHGLGSLYVSRCENLKDLKNAEALWKTRSPNDPQWATHYLNTTNDYHLEEAFEGELLSVEALSFRGKFKVLGLLSRILHSQNPVIEMGSCFPYPHPLSEKIISLVEKAHQELGFTDGPTHTEVIVNKKGEVEIIDLNPRFVGADVLQSINFAYGMEIQNLLLDFALGQEPSFVKNKEQFSCLQYFLPPSVEQFQKIDFPQTSDIKFKTTFLKPCTSVVRKDSQLDYLACFLTTMPTFKQAVERSRELRDQILINQRYQGVY